MKKAFITGITGQDGSYLAEFLLDKGYDIHGLVRCTSNPNNRNLQNLRGRVTLHDGDIGDSLALARLIGDIRPDEVYNFAALAGVTPSFHQVEYTLDVGGVSVARLLEAIRIVDPKIRFFQACSSHIFGDTTQVPQNELTPLQPISPYGCSKALGLHLIRYYRKTYSIFACSAIYYAHISPRYSEKFLLGRATRFLWNALRGDAGLLKVGNLDVPTDVGYAPEYVEATWRMMQLDCPDDYIIATGETHTPREFLTLAFQIAGLDLGKHLHIDESIKRPVEVGILVGDTAKALAAFGFSSRTSFRKLVELMVKHPQ